MDKRAASPFRRSLGLRITASYFILLVLAFLIAGTSFNTLTRQFLIRETKENLREQGNVIVNMYKGPSSLPTQNDLRTGRVLANLIDADSVIVDTKGVITATNRPRRFPVGDILVYPRMQKVLAGSEESDLWNDRDRDMVAVGLPLLYKDGAVKGGVFLFSRLEGIDAMGRQINRALFKGLLLSGLIALIIGVFFSRSISKPARTLSAAAMALAGRRYDTDLPLDRADELGEVARSFAVMRDRIRRFDEMQRSFLQTASHELKTPLMSIQGYAEGIKDGVFEGAEAEKGLDIIITESQRLKGIVDEMILLSKLESMDGLYRFQPIRLSEVAHEGVEKLQGLALELGKELRFAAPSDVSGASDSDELVSGDRDKLLQAIINLMSNALRHARDGVLVTASNHCIQVRDDGDGIDPDELPHLFQRFFKGKRGDTGLGLSIAMVIAEKHGGTITASNAPAGGALFELSLSSSRHSAEAVASPN
ncbi:HAMP domain-containing protein [Heliobacterium gestii]|uniref:histidine kinase n=1 Tax=Heliomicrobium gestii TaxID=2699 RepID=A0A845LAW7_HELGE|nr:HAMP domain-containing sensor histidine kinase [Heliomicrobium gestii]MBM7866220.1 signal transduction histidine kinase [Heliomicrobium gestii]MZP42454.1 HAMP domain-containing protein [Heliomicrobium gestii]